MVDKYAYSGLIGATEAARLLKVNPSTLWRWVKKGKAVPVRKGDGQQCSFTPQEIKRLQNEREQFIRAVTALKKKNVPAVVKSQRK